MQSRVLARAFRAPSHVHFGRSASQGVGDHKMIDGIDLVLSGLLTSTLTDHHRQWSLNENAKAEEGIPRWRRSRQEVTRCAIHELMTLGQQFSIDRVMISKKWVS